jgi:hypothetical protein
MGIVGGLGCRYLSAEDNRTHAQTSRSLRGGCSWDVSVFEGPSTKEWKRISLNWSTPFLLGIVAVVDRVR